MRRLIALVLIGMLLSGNIAVANKGEMGQMGGISEGSNLPKTIEKYVDIPSSTTNTYQYKEVVFVTGEPVIFEGTIEVAINNQVTETVDKGSYTETYQISGTNIADEGTLERTLSFVTYYRVVEGEFKKQIITTSDLSDWTEVIKVGDETYTIDREMSSFSKAGVEDMTPGVSYFETSVSYVGKYIDADQETIIETVEGTNYGYNQPWSKIETQNRTIDIIFSKDGSEDMNVITESILEAKKTIYYDETEPYPISFEGTYNQRMEREGTLTYKINTNHRGIATKDLTGSISIVTANQIEKLLIPENLDFLKGHWAEADFKKLYSMEVFTELPHSGMQYEAISRGEFIKALCLAMNIDTSNYMEGSEDIIFGDVTKDHLLYPYIMAAYDHKLIKGTGENFDIDRPINREEGFVVYIRVIGLERLGVTQSPVTPFVDDEQIASWAKKEIMAGYKLGIIKGDTEGNVNPKQWIAKAEAAAIINRLIDYLREDISKDYRK